MAPFPEELDVFSVPHSRMKELVENYSSKMSTVDFANSASTASLLRSLDATFEVFSSHERIENEFILRELQSRLRELQALDGESALVCNCHSDNRLGDMLQLVRDGHQCRSLSERLDYGRKLAAALADFTHSFLPHMKEEEEVFQPMLLKYFDYDELRTLKAKVIEQHERCCQPDAELDEAAPEKFCLEVADLKPDVEWKVQSPTTSDAVDNDVCLVVTEHLIPCVDKEKKSPSPFDSLPPEMTLKIFSYLWPPDLGRCAVVCKTWKWLVRRQPLWRHLFPTNWSKGMWDNREDEYFPEEGGVNFNRCDDCGSSCRQRPLRDEDADVDESCEAEVQCSDDEDSYCDNSNGLLDCRNAAGRSERRVVQALTTYLLPHVGENVHFLSLAGSQCLEGEWLAIFLYECPRLRGLNLSYTNLNYDVIDCMRSHLEFLRDAKADEVDGQISNGFTLRHLDLSGCPAITDDALIAFFECSQLFTECFLESLNLSGCFRLTDAFLRFLVNQFGSFFSLERLDLSGCSHMSGEALTEFVDACPNLRPEQLFYCDNVCDGPYEESANGCQNRGNQFRNCCCVE